MINIAIFASGSGSNAQCIAEYFKENKKVCIASILSNKKDAFVLERAKKYNIPTFVFDRFTFYETNEVYNYLKSCHIDFIVLAGFLWLVPNYLTYAYPNKIINIHPALLPNYGGKGMYGMHVHEAVIKNNETKSGITIHFVNSEYDKGDIIFQTQCLISPSDTPQTLAEKIHKLEHEHFPKIIEKLILNIQ